MGYEISMDGMAEISSMLEQLQDKAEGAASRGLYRGASVMQKAIRKEMDSVKTEEFKYAKNGETRLPSPEEKAVLEKAGIGIAKFDRNGAEVNTSVGFNQSGYADVEFTHMKSGARTNYKGVKLKGSAHTSSSLLKAMGIQSGGKNQKPIGVIANAINSGTSFMKKQPFVRKGAAAGKGKAEEAIREQIESDLQSIINKGDKNE